MQTATITPNGYVKLPPSMIKKLGIKNGSQVSIVDIDDGIKIESKREKAKQAVAKARKGFKGEAERLGLNSVDDVAKMVKECRKERGDKK